MFQHKISVGRDDDLMINVLCDKIGISKSEFFREFISFHLSDYVNLFDDDKLKELALAKYENKPDIVAKHLLSQYIFNFKEREKFFNDFYLIMRTSERETANIHLNQYLKLALEVYKNNPIMSHELLRFKTYINSHSWKNIFLMYDRITLENNTPTDKKQGFIMGLQSTLQNFKNTIDYKG